VFSLKFKKGDKPSVDKSIVPTRFKRHPVGRTGKLNELTPEQKVVAALTKCLAAHGASSGNNYYLSGEEMCCREMSVTGDPGKSSYVARGRFKIGKLEDGVLRHGVASFDIQFRDSEDELGLPDLTIERVDMTELPRNSPLI